MIVRSRLLIIVFLFLLFWLYLTKNWLMSLGWYLIMVIGIIKINVSWENCDFMSWYRLPSDFFFFFFICIFLRLILLKWVIVNLWNMFGDNLAPIGDPGFRWVGNLNYEIAFFAMLRTVNRFKVTLLFLRKVWNLLIVAVVQWLLKRRRIVIPLSSSNNSSLLLFFY